MNISLIDILLLVVTGITSFAIGRWVSRKRRARKAERDKQLVLTALAESSRQVRRAAARKKR